MIVAKFEASLEYPYKQLCGSKCLKNLHAFDSIYPSIFRCLKLSKICLLLISVLYIYKMVVVR